MAQLNVLQYFVPHDEWPLINLSVGPVYVAASVGPSHMAYALRRWVLVPETLRSFRISSLLCSSAPLRFDTVYSEHGEILKRRGKEEQRKTERE